MAMSVTRRHVQLNRNGPDLNQGQALAAQPAPTKRGSKRKPQKKDNRCDKCGNTNHQSGDCKVTELYCTHCDLESHDTAACRTKGNNRAAKRRKDNK